MSFDPNRMDIKHRDHILDALQVARPTRPPVIGSTDIERAIMTAIAAHQGMEYTEGEIIIVTDGEDNGGINPTRVRKALVANRLKLHAIMLGVNNEKLRQCADVYQVVEQDLTVRSPVKR
jgi:uncharacterized protein with von Willebrand factor type A (vWA) domain